MSTVHATRPLPNTLAIGLARGGMELRQFFRHKEQVVFTFALPALLMVLLGSLNSGTVPNTTVSTGTLLAASMIGAGIISTSFNNTGIGLAANREDGTLKRLRGTPMPSTSYFIGKIVLVAIASLAEAILMMAVSMALFDLKLPTDPAKWLTLLWVFALGVISCSILGIAISSVARSAGGAVAVINLVYICLQFISGVFLPASMLPKIMIEIASFFPVKWICQGFRSVFLPDQVVVYEMAGQWELGKVALVLGAWCVVGLVLCKLTFRWTNSGR